MSYNMFKIGDVVVLRKTPRVLAEAIFAPELLKPMTIIGADLPAICMEVCYTFKEHGYIISGSLLLPVSDEVLYENETYV